jgi:hypothetical protein
MSQGAAFVPPLRLFRRHGYLVPNARLSRAKYPAKYVGKYRQKCRRLRTHLHLELCLSLHLDLDLNLNLNLNPSLYRAFFAKSYKS